MKKTFKGKFETLFENHLTRYQQGGILQGDIVKIREDAFQNPIVASKMENWKEQLKNAMETDLNLRVGSIKSIRPNTAQNYDGYGTDAPDGYFVDIVVEYAPGLWRDPITVPIEILERIDTGIEMAPIPDSLKRPDPTGDDSEAQKVDQTTDRGVRTMAQTDTKQINANKWDDKAPGGGNAPKKKKLAKESVQLEEAYNAVYDKKVVNESLGYSRKDFYKFYVRLTGEGLGWDLAEYEKTGDLTDGLQKALGDMFEYEIHRHRNFHGAGSEYDLMSDLAGEIYEAGKSSHV